MLLCLIDLICIVCVLEKRNKNKGFGPKIFLKSLIICLGLVVTYIARRDRLFEH
jgi:hypothetical protein